MKKEAEKQCIPEFGKRGGLIIDKMTNQDDLVIVKDGDSWHLVGVVDMDSISNDIDTIRFGEKKVQLATHAFQLLFHGMTGFRWPVAYFGSNPALAYQIYNVYWRCVDILYDFGFTVDNIMFDGASTNRKFTAMVFSNADPRSASFMFTDVFNPAHTMCLIQDIMHVLKKIRNNIESGNLSNKDEAGKYLLLNGQPIVWDHWRECYQFNIQGGFCIHKNLTDDHIHLTNDNKMRNDIAIQVLNTNMLFLMKMYQSILNDPERLGSSVELLENTSVLTNIYCSTNRPMCSTSDPRFASLNDVIRFFNSWEETVQNSILYSPPKHLITQETRDDINSSLVGFTSLCKLLLGNGNSINPGYKNSDIVENHFGQQRGIRHGLDTNPTLALCGPANTAIILGQCSVSNKINTGKSASFYKATMQVALNPGQRQVKRNSLRL